MKKNTQCILAITFLIAGGAFAADKAKFFAKYDANKDGIMQKSEYMTMRATFKSTVEKSEQLFAAKDKDKNGSLTKKEFGIK